MVTFDSRLDELRVAPGLLFTNKPGFYRRPQICRLPIVILNGKVEIGPGGGKEIQAHHSPDPKPRVAPTPVLEGPTLDEFRTWRSAAAARVLG